MAQPQAKHGTTKSINMLDKPDKRLFPGFCRTATQEVRCRRAGHPGGRNWLRMWHHSPAVRSRPAPRSVASGFCAHSPRRTIQSSSIGSTVLMGVLSVHRCISFMSASRKSANKRRKTAPRFASKPEIQLAELARSCYARGWLLGTSGRNCLASGCGTRSRGGHCIAHPLGLEHNTFGTSRQTARPLGRGL
jgi:hypothetical protein